MSFLELTLLIIALVAGGLCIYLYVRLSRVRKDSLKTMEQRRSGFVSIISHQLRTPLSVIKGFLEGLQTGDQGELSDGQKEYVEDALRVSRDTIELVNDYLHIAKLEPGKLELNRKEADIIQLVRDQIEKLATLARASNCELVFDSTHPAPIILNIDSIKIKQVIENILTNAIKYTSGKGKAVVNIARRGPDLLIVIRDNGVGIPEDEQEAIFTKFFRAKNILHKDTVGSGLGLYLARMIVEAHGGSIWFESKENEGTTFFITLPLPTNPE